MKGVNHLISSLKLILLGHLLAFFIKIIRIVLTVLVPVILN